MDMRTLKNGLIAATTVAALLCVFKFSEQPIIDFVILGRIPATNLYYGFTALLHAVMLIACLILICWEAVREIFQKKHDLIRLYNYADRQISILKLHLWQYRLSIELQFLQQVPLLIRRFRL